MLAGVEGRILILGQNDEIILMDADGTDGVTVAGSEEGTERSQPTWSVAGDQFAWTERQEDGETKLVTAGRDGVALTSSVVPFMAVYMAWSPTGDVVALMGNDESGEMQLVLATPSGRSTVFDEGSPMYFDWVPDGSGLLVHIGDRLEIAPVSGDRFPLETDGDFRVGLHAGDALVYGVDAGVGEVLVLRSNTIEQPEGLLRYAAPAAAVATPTGDRLAILARGSRETAAVLEFDDPTLPTLTPGQLVVLDLDSGETTTVIESPLVSWHWSPDGQLLLHSAQVVEEGDLLLKWAVSSDGQTNPYGSFDPTAVLGSEYLAFFDQMDRSTSFWSPDSKAFVYASATGVWVQPLGAFEPTVIATGKVAVWSPT